MNLTFEEVKKNASNEIRDLIWNELSIKLRDLTNLKRYEKNLYKIIDFHIGPVFNEIIENNQSDLEKKLEDINKEEIDIEEKQYKMNEEINSLLTMWKKTVLTTKMATVSKEGGRYLKSVITDTTKLNYKKRDKILKTREEFKRKYKFD